jgi:hypothetical protein
MHRIVFCLVPCGFLAQFAFLNGADQDGIVDSGWDRLILLLESSNPKTLISLLLKGKLLGTYFQAVSSHTTEFNMVNLAGLFIVLLIWRCLTGFDRRH